MQGQKLILFDFDGVIVDGLEEYWHSSLFACKKYLSSKEISTQLDLNQEVSKTFITLRPWVKYGWEMLIITHEIVKNNEPLDNSKVLDFVNKYEENCLQVMEKNSWNPEKLQKYLDQARKSQINADFKKWVDKHIPFKEVLSLIKVAEKRNIKVGIITTKGEAFASKILKEMNILPQLIFGYESGSKVEIISKLVEEYKVIGFVEDRKKTLINVSENQNTSSVPCYLAEWGYLKENDRLNLPDNIKLIKLKDLKDLLAY